MPTQIIYPGYREEKRIEWKSWAGQNGKPAIASWAIEWQDDLELVPDGTGFWVNGAGLRGLRYEPEQGEFGKLLGRPARGKKPEVFLMVDDDNVYVCKRGGHRVLVA